MIIEGKFLDLNLKKNTNDNYHYFECLEILCNKFTINQLKSRFEYLLNDNVANLIKNLNKSKKVIISRNLIEKNLSSFKYQYLMKFFTLSSIILKIVYFFLLTINLNSKLRVFTFSLRNFTWKRFTGGI